MDEILFYFFFRERERESTQARERGVGFVSSLRQSLPLSLKSRTILRNLKCDSCC